MSHNYPGSQDITVQWILGIIASNKSSKTGNGIIYQGARNVREKDERGMNRKAVVIRCCDCGKELKSARKDVVTHRCSGCWSRWRPTRGKENVKIRRRT
jgi:hypothetical protein